MLSALIYSIHSYPTMPLVGQLVHHRYVHPGPLVLGTNPLKFPIVHSGYNPNCLTRVIPLLLMARTISSPFICVYMVRGWRVIGLKQESYLMLIAILAISLYGDNLCDSLRKAMTTELTLVRFLL